MLPFVSYAERQCACKAAVAWMNTMVTVESVICILESAFPSLSFPLELKHDLDVEEQLVFTIALNVVLFSILTLETEPLPLRLTLTSMVKLIFQ